MVSKPVVPFTVIQNPNNFRVYNFTYNILRRIQIQFYQIINCWWEYQFLFKSRKQRMHVLQSKGKLDPQCQSTKSKPWNYWRGSGVDQQGIRLTFPTNYVVTMPISLNFETYHSTNVTFTWFAKGIGGLMNSITFSDYKSD